MTTHETSPRTKRRADAERNIETILDAARAVLSRDPDASIGQIAGSAGVGRVTLYGHFPTRADLVAEVVRRALADAEEAFDRIDLTGDPREALGRLVAGSWSLTADAGALLAAAEQALPAEDVRAAHDGLFARVTALIDRGRAEGVFRTDLPSSWLVSVLHSLVHCAATEVAAGRLPAERAAEYIVSTALPSFAPPVARPAGGAHRDAITPSAS
ncbi:TetR/AcrR family transcriptional regulator [Rhodococcus sp. CH91]|uniref:TetR/AcrR family transcriptional regulator n=1 Tax=Rhodococcus sp. CH91 TaxID=2910256 RepID=UPI001F4B3896|nr:TetR/AcrR family transcriptional regulator [Rhodococcus sp. CH91]